MLATGLPASPGAAVGQVVFTADDAVEKSHKDKQRQVILVRSETVPDDIHGMEVAAGILTSRGGMTSHAAVVTRGMGKCCVAGAGDLEVDENAARCASTARSLKEGDWISLDGPPGREIDGRAERCPQPSRRSLRLQKILTWAEPLPPYGRARECRHSRDAYRRGRSAPRHRPVPHRAHVLRRGPISARAEDDPGRQRRRPPEALRELLPLQREDFYGVFKAMDGCPVTIRTIDPPLHEFLPKREELMVEIASWRSPKPKTRAQAREERARLLQRGSSSCTKFNPMLGHRGCRLGITYPEITEMQTRAIIEAAVRLNKEGVKVIPKS